MDLTPLHGFLRRIELFERDGSIKDVETTAGQIRLFLWEAAELCREAIRETKWESIVEPRAGRWKIKHPHIRTRTIDLGGRSIASRLLTIQHDHEQRSLGIVGDLGEAHFILRHRVLEAIARSNEKESLPEACRWTITGPESESIEFVSDLVPKNPRAARAFLGLSPLLDTSAPSRDPLDAFCLNSIFLGIARILFASKSLARLSSAATRHGARIGQAEELPRWQSAARHRIENSTKGSACGQYGD